MHLRDNILRWWRALLFAAMLAGGANGFAQTVDIVINTNLFEPYGVAVDDLNNYYITDSAHNRIGRFDPNTGVLTNLAGFPEENGFGAVDGGGQFARFYNPQGIVAVSDGLIISDSGNHLIRKVTFGGVVTTLAGDLALSAADPSSSRGSVDGVGAAARFNSPAGLASDGKGNIYIADSLNNTIRKLNLATREVTTICDTTSFLRPTAVAIDEQGWIYVADTGNHSIKRFKEGGPVTLVAGSGSRFVSGFVNSPVGLSALFNSPRGLLWAGTNTQLLVSDSGNGVIRRISNVTSDPLMVSVETFGNTDRANPRVITPVGLAKDTGASILFADLSDNAIRIVRVSQVNQPAVVAPAIGTVTLTNFCGTILRPVTNATFNNEVVIAMRTEPGTETFYTFGPTESFDTIPDPTRSSLQPPPYGDCSDELPINILDLITPRPPRLTIKAYSTQLDRRPSSVIVAQFTFQVGNPIIIGNNPGALRMDTVTRDAEIWYTTGSSDATTQDPTNRAPAIRYTEGSILSLRTTENITLKARAFRPNYMPSAIVKRNFLTNDLALGDVGTIGITRDFVAGIGSTIVVPVEVSVSPNNTVQSLQFRVQVSPLGGGRTIAMRDLPISTNDFIPVLLGGSATAGNFFKSVISETDGVASVLGYAFAGTNATFNLSSASTVAVLGLQVPTNAATGDKFIISVSEASATTDGLQTPATLTALDARTITVTNQVYLVGDSAVGAGYNLGEFGDGDLKNNDVNNAFFASLGLRVPYRFSDVFDAMDVFPEDTLDKVGGDGQIRFLDWQILLSRSLRFQANRWQRRWSASGTRIAVPPLSGVQDAEEALQDRQAVGQSQTNNQVVWKKPALLGALTLENLPQTAPAAIPVYLRLAPGAVLSGMQFVAYVVPEGATPPIHQNIQFIPADGVPAPSISGNTVPGTGVLSNAVYCAWNLGAFPSGLTGSNLLGRIHFNIPGGAVTGTRYVVYFVNADGSSAQKPNGSYDQYDFETIRGAVWVNALATIPAERLSDEWKQFYFNSLTDPIAQRSADPDGDGASNETEFRDGTDPTRSNLRFILRDSDWRKELAQNRIALSWFGASGHAYTLQTLVNLKSTNWATLTTNLTGSGAVLTYTNNNSNPNTQFFRLQIAPQKQP